ncbi:hypothetical protein CASFOL_019151 [Castilleja foliolosa]|uniref:NAC domain-containing protein n=1 Tax=Castilleja foliolosa TaxID=1961234 RepID=A0ABD3D4D0_9LAMI
MESTDSSSGSQQPQLPPGFRFHPTDEELVVHYLKKKAASVPLPVTIIADVDLYKFDPWELPSKAIFGEQEWYFFSPRDRKYPNGARPNRAATSGYWKATGTDKPVLTAGGTQKVGVKKALVFYGGKPPKGIKTNWIMHEYRLADNKPNPKPPGFDYTNKKASLRLDDWVLCRIYKKNNVQRPIEQERDDLSDVIGPIISPNISIGQQQQHDHQSMYEINMMNHEHQGMGSHLGSSRANLNLHMAHNLLPTKREVTNLYWNVEDRNPDAKRFMSENEVQITPSMQQNQQTMMGNIGVDGVFEQQGYQVPGMNWYT